MDLQFPVWEVFPRRLHHLCLDEAGQFQQMLLGLLIRVFLIALNKTCMRVKKYIRAAQALMKKNTCTSVDVSVSRSLEVCFCSFLSVLQKMHFAMKVCLDNNFHRC